MGQKAKDRRQSLPLLTHHNSKRPTPLGAERTARIAPQRGLKPYLFNSNASLVIDRC